MQQIIMKGFFTLYGKIQLTLRETGIGGETKSKSITADIISNRVEVLRFLLVFISRVMFVSSGK